jgi:hypothetical protein
MLDPLSTTKVVLTIVESSISSIQTIQSFANKYANADLEIASLLVTCLAVRTALLRLQDSPALVLVKRARNPDDPKSAAIRDQYEAVVCSCSVLFSVLDKKLNQFKIDGLTKMGKATVAAKLKYIWNEQQIESLASQITRMVQGLNLFISEVQRY